MSLRGKVAIVTGAAKGIGRAIATRFARDGARVVLSDIDEVAGRSAAEALQADGAEARFVRCDVGARDQCVALVEAAIAAFGRLDILVNNAGIVHAADLLELDEADFDRVLRVNLKGPFLMCKAAVPAMIAQGGGAIINMSSINAVVTIPNQIPYSVSKGGLAQLTRVLAVGLADKGIRVNASGPGSIMTDMLATIMTDDAVRRRLMSRTPLGRPGRPEEVAAIAAFLAGDESSYVTGQTIYPDGGRLALNMTVPVKD